MSTDVNLFFDESGTDNAKEITLMGSLLFPKTYYESPRISELTDQLREGVISIHFSKYNVSKYREYKRVLEIILEKSDYLRFNIIAFRKGDYLPGHRAYRSHVSTMIYDKIPDRVIYGSLRDFGTFSEVNANLYIEESTQYIEANLHKKLKTQLNVHSLYRNEKFFVNQSRLYPKKKEIGIEVTDMLLGIVRIVLKNEPAIKNNGELKKSLWNKKKFIYSNRGLLESFFKRIYYFELDGSSELFKKNFHFYLMLFYSQFEHEDVQIGSRSRG